MKKEYQNENYREQRTNKEQVIKKEENYMCVCERVRVRTGELGKETRGKRAREKMSGHYFL